MSKSIYNKNVRSFTRELKELGSKFESKQIEEIINFYKEILPEHDNIQEIIESSSKFLESENGNDDLYILFLNGFLDILGINMDDEIYDYFDENYGLSDDDFINLMVNSYNNYMEKIIPYWEKQMEKI
jgi:hypothetical protein